MPLIDYTGWRPGVRHAAVAMDHIDKVNAICRDFHARGYSVTLRQLHYQFVKNNWHPNTDQAYKTLGSLVTKARRAGLIDWSHVEDRTRFLRGRTQWGSPAQLIDHMAASYHTDWWATQPTRVEVWVEKDALVDVVGRPAHRWDVDYFSCRGNVSDSEMWRAGRRLKAYTRLDQDVLLLHLGDHDPSGLDMTRDITDRLWMFMGREASDRLEVRRIALNMDQVTQYALPPNPAKESDSRHASYVERYGPSSWELDALDPDVIVALIDGHIEGAVDAEALAAAREAERDESQDLRDVQQHWAEVVEWLHHRREVQP